MITSCLKNVYNFCFSNSKSSILSLIDSDEENIKSSTTTISAIQSKSK